MWGETMKFRLPIALLAVLVVFSTSQFAGAANESKLWMPMIFGDNMVLQSGKATKVWGWASPGESITVKIGDKKAKGKAGEDGKWMATLKGLKETSEPQVLTIKGKDSTISYKNVLIGDVWLGSGQSNMEWVVSRSTAGKKEVNSANYPEIRLFRIPGILSDKPADDVSWEDNGAVFNGKQRVTDPNTPKGQWVVCSPKTVPAFSAVLYFFGREIHLQTGKPVGLISSALGGTRIEMWTPLDVFYSNTALTDYGKWIDNDKAAYEDAVAKGPEAMKSINKDINSFRNFSKLYNGMIHPIIPFGIKGVIWYQGEANGGEDDSYITKTNAMVSSWRKLWGRGEFPFYYVQLANWVKPNDAPEGGDGWAKIRDAQRKTICAVPHTGMASTIDIGNSEDIHPKDKQDVGKRLALWALKNDYGFTNIVESGPLYKSMKIEGNKIRLSFDCTGTGLMVGEKDGIRLTKEVAGGTLKWFAIAGADKKWFWADAKIDGDTVVVSSPDVSSPVAVRYAFCMNPLGANLYNKEGLPASPFRTDNW